MLYLSALIWIVWWCLWLIVGRSSKTTIYCEPFRERITHLIPLLCGVALIFSGFAINPFIACHVFTMKIIGIIVTIFGLSIACWSRIHLGRNWSGLVVIKDNHELISTGPYRIVRHPIYTGLIIAMVGSAITAGTAMAVIGVYQIVLAFTGKIKNEERLLLEAFDHQYSTLCEKVPYKLFPMLF